MAQDTQDLDPKLYEKNTPIVEAAASGEIDLGLVNHYYLYLVQEEQPDAPIANHFLAAGDPGALVSVASAASSRLGSAGRRRAVRRVPALRRGAAVLWTRPRRPSTLIPRGSTPSGLPPLSTLEGPDVDLTSFGAEHEATIEMLRETGYLTAVAGRGRTPPLPLVLAAGVVVALLLLPLAYLVVRAASGGQALDILGEATTWRLVWSTLLLAVGVVTSSVVVGVPLAWLVTRTDLTARRAWATAAAPAARDPELRRRVLPARLLRRAGPARGRARCRAPSGGRGYWGSLVALTLATYPYVFLLAQSALRTLDPALEEAAAARQLRSEHVLPRHPPRPAPGRRPRRAARRPLHALGLRRRVPDELRHARARSTSVQEPLRPRPRRHARAPARGAQRVALVVEYRLRQRGRLYRSGQRRRPQPLVRLGRWRAPALAFCSVVVGLFLVLPTAVLGYWLSRGAANERALGVP